MTASNKNIALVFADRLDDSSLLSLQSARIQKIKNILINHNFAVASFARNELPDSLDAFDFTVAVGGDGTQLDAAMRLRNKPLCAIRLFPDKSVGFLCTEDYPDFESLLDKIESGTAERIITPRLQAVVDGIPQNTPALNEFLLANACPARAARYTISFGSLSQNQCSSGIWIATQPGSHGANKSAGGLVLPVDNADLAAFCVRECAAKSEQTLWRGSFSPLCDKFSITVKSPKLEVFADGGLASFTIFEGQTLTFARHPAPLIRLSCRHG